MFRAAAVNDSGRRSLVSDVNKAISPVPVMIPCGQCVGCRLERSRVWAVRIMQEASLHKSNCFITLTYNDAHLPVNGSLVKSDFQNFMKRLRKRLGTKVRYYYCGEYGEELSRPHYHAIIFGYDFPDKYAWRTNFNGNDCFRSSLLDSLWGFGFTEIGSVTFQSAAYVARYIMKKRTGSASAQYYGDRLPEYTDMSRRPGIGYGFVNKFLNDIYPNDFVIMNGIKMRPPRFYDNVYDVLSPGEMERVKDSRIRKARKFRTNNTKVRLRVREFLSVNRASRLKRSF